MLNNTEYHIVKLYYPSKDQDNKPLEGLLSNKIYKQLCQDVCNLSGGLTVYPVKGLFLSSTGKLIDDDISLIQVFTDKLDSMIAVMKSNAMIILKELNQESVLIEVDNQIEFIR
jgi:hypothetical protein